MCSAVQVARIAGESTTLESHLTRDWLGQLPSDIMLKAVADAESGSKHPLKAQRPLVDKALMGNIDLRRQRETNAVYSDEVQSSTALTVILSSGWTMPPPTQQV